MNFGVITNIKRDANEESLKLIERKIKALGHKVVFSGELSSYELKNNNYEQVDVIIAMGGDGTFLNIARRNAFRGIPILGINTGHLGFLSAVDIKDVDIALESVVKGKFSVEERTMLEAVTCDNKYITALNDMVFSRGQFTKVVACEVFVDDVYLDTFLGDGIIVSTPTGSTGYSLSAGGPVVDHTLDVIVFTPISAHTMHAKSFVLRSDATIKVKIVKSSEICYMNADGQMEKELNEGDTVVINKSLTKAKVIRFSESTMFSTLRQKIYYRNI